jgi:hypothetical protein
MASRIAASSLDRRIWGRAFRGFPGGFGTGSFEDEGQLDGRLTGSVPISESQLRAIWDEFGIGKGEGSAWRQLENFNEFFVNFDAAKFSQFPFRSKEPIEIRGLRFFYGLSVPDLLDTAERLIKRLEIPPPIPEHIRELVA